jgi:hypothetical protein
MTKLAAVLSSRLVLFLFFQILTALFLGSWDTSVRYWPLAATLTNVVCIIVLHRLLKQEDSSFLDLFRFQKSTWKADALWFLMLLVISVPAAIAPSLALSTVLWGNTEYYHQVLFQPLDRLWVIFLLFVFPVSTGLAELPTYFGYVMPRLRAHITQRWLIVAVPVIAFSLQHCTLPLLFEPKFIVFRGTMYLFYSLIFGIALYKRPSLLPWLATLQFLVYILPAMMLLNVSR